MTGNKQSEFRDTYRSNNTHIALKQDSQ